MGAFHLPSPCLSNPCFPGFGENPWPENWAEGGFPLSDVTFNETWAKMEELLETGKVRAIGVSNFSIKTWVDVPAS